MKRIIASAIMLIIVFAMLVTSTFAWQMTIAKGYYTSSNLHIGIEADKSLKISLASDMNGTSDFTSSLYGYTNMIPVTSSDGITFYMETSQQEGVSMLSPVNDLTGKVYSQTVYVSSECEYSVIKLSNVQIVGNGASDLINKSLRIAVISPYGSFVYTPNGNNQIRAYFGANPLMVTIRIWYDGLDDNCTFENSIKASGNVSAILTFEGI